MSDPIADILMGHCFMPPEHNNDPADLERAMAEQVAKQIRQQIGRELHVELTKAVIDEPRSDTSFGVNIGLEKAAIITSKVCQMENE